MVHLDEYESRGIYWIVLSVNVENVTYFDGRKLENSLDIKI